MTLSRFCRALRACLLAFLPVFLLPIAQAQAARKTVPETSISDAHADPEAKRAEWFLRGRIVPGKSSAELRRRAYQAKMQARAARGRPRSCKLAAANGLRRMDLPGPRPAGLGRYRHRISELQPGFRTCHRRSHRSRRPQRQYRLHRGRAGWRVEVHKCGNKPSRQCDLDCNH